MSHDTRAHRIVRPIVRPLVGTPITPNHLTVLRLLTGAGAAVLLAGGDPFWSDVAGGIFVLSFLLDRADGELARQSGRTSASGHRFDLYADYSANIMVFVGIGLGMQGGPMGRLAVALGAVAGAAIGAIFWVVSRTERVEGHAEFSSAKGFDPDDAMIIVPLALWLDAEAYILWAAAIGAPLFLAWTAWRFRSSLSAIRPSLNEHGVPRNR